MASPATGGPIDLRHLPWSVYAYGPDGFARKRLVGHNLNIIGYPFPLSTGAVSSLYPSLSFFAFLYLCHFLDMS